MESYKIYQNVCSYFYFTKDRTWLQVFQERIAYYRDEKNATFIPYMLPEENKKAFQLNILLEGFTRSNPIMMMIKKYDRVHESIVVFLVYYLKTRQ